MTLKELRALRARPRTPASARALNLRIADMLKAECPPNVPWTHLPAGEPLQTRPAEGPGPIAPRPGWPDFLFVLPDGRLGGIEIRTEAGGLAPARRQWRADVQAAGARWAECRTAGGVREALRRWGVVLGGPLGSGSPTGRSPGRGPADPFRNRGGEE